MKSARMTRFVLCALVLTGCSKKDPADDFADRIASCNMPTLQSCQEYRGANLALGTKLVEELCKSPNMDMRFGLVPCPTEKMIGSCQRNEGKDFYYEGYVIELAKLESSCTERGGTFAKP
ncbi:MAG: hypothetical protein JWP01_3264 [Myxococcales bacterium]|nr:hypothetical protein [Myxococcales bacterium]